MRKQYHFRRSEQGLLAWDVDKLILQTVDLPIQQIALISIAELDETYWFENTLPTCRNIANHMKLVEEANLVYPIILSSNGRVMGGMY